MTRNSRLVLPLRVVALASRTSVASWEHPAGPLVVALLGYVRGNVADSLNRLRNPTLIFLWHIHSGGNSSVYGSRLTRARTANGPIQRAANVLMWSPCCAPRRACVSTRFKSPGSNFTAYRLLSYFLACRYCAFCIHSRADLRCSLSSSRPPKMAGSRQPGPKSGHSAGPPYKLEMPERNV